MRKNLGMLALIMAFWFTISFITNILGPLIPDIIHNFNLSDLAMAGFIPTSFFLAYAIMSIPAGLLIDRFGEKPVLFGGFLMPFIGTILFACMHTYPMLLASSFIIGLGIAMLQTGIESAPTYRRRRRKLCIYRRTGTVHVWHCFFPKSSGIYLSDS